MKSVWSWLGKSSTQGKFCTKCQSASAEQNSNASFVAVKARRMAEKHQEHQGDASNMSPVESDDDDNCDNERKLFFCPEDGCVKSY